MILDTRQIQFGAVQVPEIERYNAEIMFSREYEIIKKRLVEALVTKYVEGHEPYEPVKIIEDCVSQSLNFLILIGATKDFEVDLKKEIIRVLEKENMALWKELIRLSPIYEGIAIQLKTMLIKHHYPSMYEEISKGRIYSHWGLTIIKESVIYTLEYLEKNNLLLNDLELLKRDNIKKWLMTKN